MRKNAAGEQKGTEKANAGKGSGFCAEKYRLLRDYGDALTNWSRVIGEQTEAVINDEPDFSRFDALVHMAGQRKDQAKYTYIRHVHEHGCGDDM